MTCPRPRARAGRRRAVLAGTLLLVSIMPVLAQEGSHPVDSALEMMNLKTHAGPMPDFVTQSRGSQDDSAYLPVGAKPPARALKPKSATEVQALTAELDAARDAQVAGKRPKPMGTGAPATAKPVKAPVKTAKPRPTAVQATNR